MMQFVSAALIFLCVLFLLGCQDVKTPIESPTDSLQTGEQSMDETEKTQSESEGADVSQMPDSGVSQLLLDAVKNIDIYKFSSREDFEEFVKNPALNLNREFPEPRFHELDGVLRYIRGSSLFELSQQIIDFLTIPEKMDEYLSEQGVTQSVVCFALLDAPQAPISVWIQTEESHWFVTLYEDPHEDDVYRLYSQEDYVQKYLSVSAALEVDGVLLTDVTSVKIHGASPSMNASVPLLSVLKALGATVVGEEGDVVELSFRGETYFFSIKENFLCRGSVGTQNLLHLVTGSPVFMTETENDLLVDVPILNCALQEMGAPVWIRCDKDNRVVKIDFKTA